MPRMKAAPKRAKRIKLDSLKNKTLADQDQEKVKGGKTPSPSDPVPIPYPNIKK